MKCPHCGNDVPEGSKFCPSCGACMEPEEGHQGTSLQPAVKKESNGDMDLFVKIAAGILAVVFVILGLMCIFNGISGLFYSIFRYFYFTGILMNILNIVKGACYLCIALAMLLIGFSEDHERLKSIFNFLCLIGVIMVIVCLLRLLFAFVGYYYVSFWYILFRPIIGTAAALFAAYVLLYIRHDAPSGIGGTGSVTETIADAVSSVIVMLQELLQDITGKKQKQQNNQS